MTRVTLRACVIDAVTATATFADGRVERLSSREVALLLYLAARPEQTVSRDELLEQVWGLETASRAVDTAMRRLREKVEAEPARPDHLITAYGEGYRFVPGPEVATEAGLIDDEPFVGRSAELARVRAWLEQPGAVAQLVGPPGAGKTRLARRACVLLGGALGASTGLVDLTEARDAAQVAHRWTAPAAGRYAFVTDGSDYDTSLLILDGDCGAELACDDDGGEGTLSRATVDLAEGEAVTVLVGGFRGRSGAFVLGVEAVPAD